MDSYVLAQVLSFIGFSILLYGVAKRTRKTLIGFDAAGLSLVTIHWYLMAAPVAVAVNLIFILNDLIALSLPDKIKAAARNAIAGVLMLGAGFLWFERAHDVLPLLASGLILFAIQQKNLKHLRILMIFANLVWSAYGFFHHTWVQVAFGILITGVHAHRLYELKKERG